MYATMIKCSIGFHRHFNSPGCIYRCRLYVVLDSTNDGYEPSIRLLCKFAYLKMIAVAAADDFVSCMADLC